VVKPEEIVPTDCKWVFTVKRNTNGTIKPKVRLVVKGFTQKYGKDFHATYTPVTKSTTIRILLNIAAQMGYNVENWDVQQHFSMHQLKKSFI
jgi:hypothetical protein